MDIALESSRHLISTETSTEPAAFIQSAESIAPIVSPLEVPVEMPIENSKVSLAVNDNVTKETFSQETTDKRQKTAEHVRDVNLTKKPRGFTPFPIPGKPKPIMASYGFGNTRPVVPENLLKTFNARAPLSEVLDLITQIYPETMQRLQRIRTFENEELNPKRKVKNVEFSDPKAVLKEYLNSRNLVQQLSLRFQTEYGDKFVDWKKRPETNAEKLTTLVALEPLVETRVSEYTREYSSRFEAPKPICGDSPAGCLSGLEPEVRKAKVDTLVYRNEATAAPVLLPQVKCPVDFVEVQSIYQKLRRLENMEKRHFKTKPTEVFCDETPGTWKLAQTVLKRASGRLIKQK